MHLRMSTGLALSWLFATVSLQPAMAIDVQVANSDQLLAAFATADANPHNFYHVYLARRQDAQGNVISWMPSRTVALTKGRVYVHGSQSRSYPERYIFDGQGQRRLFSVVAAAGYTPSLTLDGITVQNGKAGLALSGGGVYASKAQLYLYYSVFKNNSANTNGAAIRIDDGNFGFDHILVDGNANDQYSGCGGGMTSGGGGLTIAGTAFGWITSSTFSNNKACRGGGIEKSGTGTLTMWNCTISNNLAKRRGGGIFFNGGSGTTSLHFTTIAFNKAGIDPVAIPGEKNYAGGLAMAGFNGTINLYGTILAKNTVVNNMKSNGLFYTTNDCYWDGGQFTGGNQVKDNIIGELANCSQFGSTSWWGIGWDNQPFNPQLDQTLQTWGTAQGFALPVHMPLSSSPARGNFFESVAASAFCDSYDQRYFKRSFANDPSRPRCDIGAVEHGALP